MPHKLTIPRTCEQCGNAFLAEAYRVRDGLARFCCMKCKGIHQEGDLESRLLAKRTIDRVTGCWLWPGPFREFGYGFMSYKNKKTDIHRLSALLYLNHPLDAEGWVLHKCDIPACFNPRDLYIGSPQDNINDMYARGRNVAGAAKLTAEQAKAIRDAYRNGERIIDIARRFSMSHGCISHVVHNRAWKHVA